MSSVVLCPPGEKARFQVYKEAFIISSLKDQLVRGTWRKLRRSGSERGTDSGYTRDIDKPK